MPPPTCSQKVPCAKCPWRRDADPAYWHPGEFSKMAKGVVGTPLSPGLGVMLCHKSPADGSRIVPTEERSPLSGTLDEPALCAGFVAVVGYDSIGLRLHRLRTGIDPTEECSDGGLALYDSLDEMLDAVREANGG